VEQTKRVAPTRANLRRLLARLGGRLEIDSYPDSYRLFAIAPDGYHWTEGPHSLVGDVWPEFPGSAAEAYADLIDRVQAGIEPCRPDNPVCRDAGCFATAGQNPA